MLGFWEENYKFPLPPTKFDVYWMVISQLLLGMLRISKVCKLTVVSLCGTLLQNCTLLSLTKVDDFHTHTHARARTKHLSTRTVTDALLLFTYKCHKIDEWMCNVTSISHQRKQAYVKKGRPVATDVLKASLVTVFWLFACVSESDHKYYLFSSGGWTVPFRSPQGQGQVCNQARMS